MSQCGAFSASFRGQPKGSAAEIAPVLFLLSSDAGCAGPLTLTAVEPRDMGLASIDWLCAGSSRCEVDLMCPEFHHWETVSQYPLMTQTHARQTVMIYFHK